MALVLERGAAPAALDALLRTRQQAEPLASGAEPWLAWRGSTPVAGLATYLLDDLHGAPGLSGVLGHFVADDADAAERLLREASASLRVAGAARVLGPMNGSTWARYRFALAPDTPAGALEPPFLGEPTNPPDYPAWFARAGFAPVVAYESRIQRDLTTADPRAGQAAAQVAAAGLHLETLALDRLEPVLGEIHALSLESFGDNAYYRPIAREVFVAMYTPLRPILDPDLVLLARDAAGALVGFSFAYVDPLGAAAGAPGRVVLKTLVTRPAFRGVGLGGLLVDRTRSLALEKGHRAVIHALMHVRNVSKRMSERSTTEFRQYALYQLAP